jgi:hypothetical protein
MKTVFHCPTEKRQINVHYTSFSKYNVCWGFIRQNVAFCKESTALDLVLSEIHNFTTNILLKS